MSKGGINWTREQQLVIDSREENLLVSAAAGSGKTAVLVERIIQLVTRGERPLDIDRLLVMTFTRAAAAEMRERIAAAIEQKLQETPQDAHLQMQSALIHHASITTIDSFCLHIIREHFNLLDLDPAFRIGDEGELLLLREEVMAELLEERYAGGGRFERFVEAYAKGKSDSGIADYILQVYTFSQSNPRPERWLEQCRKELMADETEVFLETPWAGFLCADISRQAAELKAQLEEALTICREDELLRAYEPALSHDVEQLKRICREQGFLALHRLISEFSWDRLSSVRSKEVDQEKKAMVTACRDRAKKALGKMRSLYCFAGLEEMEADMGKTADVVVELIELAEAFTERYRAKKRERNLVDFHDLEHEALKVLIRYEEDGTMRFTEAADELSRQFEEILVDEYQDSNLVQEALLQALSRERFGRRNVFMVGDVKQSIYKFRLARPELFLEKYRLYEPYGEGKSGNKKIELHQNFRSRAEVLEAVNEIFYQIMTENLGGIRYTKESALYPGAAFEPLPVPRPKGERAVELYVMDTGNEAFTQLDEEAANLTSRELEARLIASKIREMTDPESGLFIWDKEEKRYRTARYRDMVILLRSMSGWTETFLSVLVSQGIPAYAESREGYFNTPEVETMLALLTVIDNPMQDIPLTAVLRAPICGLTDQELAMIMAEYKKTVERGPDRGIYGACLLYLERGQEKTGYQKLSGFFEQLEQFSQLATYLPIHELIYRLYQETGYYDYVSAMPAGETRRANLDMLVEKAAEYERTSYQGLFYFVRYIENLKKYHSDFGEASTVGEEDNTVRLMSIHKSKGLEFPVVFLAGMGKKFNRQDVYGKLLIDPELGIGTDCMDLESRTKTVTIKKNALRRKLELDNLGEELRVLYVAMTRAKEKLVMMGTDRYLEKKMRDYQNVPVTDGQISYTMLSAAGSYLDWVLMAAGSRPVSMSISQVPLEAVMGEELVRQVRSRQSRAFLEELDLNQSFCFDFGEEISKAMDFSYPHEPDTKLHIKLSVSEIKRLGQQIDDEESVCMERPLTMERGRYSAQEGALRGTAYHRVLQLLDFCETKNPEDVRRQMDAWVSEQKLSEEYRRQIDPRVICRFSESSLGRRMAEAQRLGKLYRERQFVIGIPAREMGLGESDELVVVQGILDACFEEDGALVLVDYKTDRVKSEEILTQHYAEQLAYYARALMQITGKPVSQKLIYSLWLHKEIDCEKGKQHEE